MDHAVERQLQKEYWQEHTAVLSVEAMMLDSQAAKLDKEERPEILASLPPIDGKSILELGAGIGRFTRELAMKASHVTACDFMENAIKKNEEMNGHIGNIKFVCADVTSNEMDFPPASVDIVFSNWLLMYLSDEEVKELAERMVKWVKKGGYVFFRESCFHKSGDNKRKFNPTHYRQPTFYTKIFQECHVKEEDMVYSELRLVSCKCVGAYVHNKYNQNQICWLWQKVESSSPEDKNFQRFLDTVQYSQKGIQLYERIFGKGFVSTGGIDTTKEFVKRLDLQPNQKVLDIGCGVGGGDFYMAETYGVEVLGIDLSINMVSIALENAIGRHCNAQFEVADCTKEELPSETFDVIYSRDAILHIQDKPALFKRMYDWLKPGGKVLISDYSRAGGSLSEEFNQYILHRGYDLHDMESYSQMLRDAGFVSLIAEDRTEQFIDILEKELRTMEQERDLFVSDFCKEDYETAVEGWKSKLKRSRKGEQRWCLFFATKSLKPKLNST